jgi:ParB/Sulfiredoxin domain
MEIPDKLEMVPVTQIRPYQRNARKNTETIKKLVEIIPRVGFNVPLVLDRNNVIVKGHSRWQAAIRLGMKAIPCVYTDADEETIKLDRIADNRIQEFSDWDKELLGSELASLNLGNFDLGILEFKIDLPAYEVPGAGPFERSDAGGEDFREDHPGNGDDDGGQPFITAEDVARTAPVRSPDYIEVVCDQCGHKLHVKK